ncbi:MAG: TlpA disulfide reductase family protein [Planctomycetota bacterium]
MFQNGLSTSPLATRCGAICIVGSMLGAPAHAQEGRAVVDAMLDAWTAVEVVSYDGHAYGGGGLANIMMDAKGPVTLARGDGDRWMWITQGTATRENQEVPVNFEFTVSEDRTGRWHWIDEDAKLKRVGRQPRSSRLMAAVNSLRPTTLTSQDGARAHFESAQSITLRDAANINGVEVDVVLLDFGTAKERWSIGREDRMPRRIEQITPLGPKVLDLNNLRLLDSIDDSVIEFAAPAGYAVNEGASSNRRDQLLRPTEVQVTDPKAWKAPDPTPKDPAPAFEFETADGGSLSSEDLKGKVVLLDFWGTWCIPCRKSSPVIQGMYGQYEDNDDVVFIAPAVREANRETPIEYWQEKGFSYTLALKGDQAAKDFEVEGYPTFIVINHRGEIEEKVRGFRPEITQEILEKALNRSIRMMEEAEG